MVYYQRQGCFWQQQVDNHGILSHTIGTINVAFAKGVIQLFHSARWKAYLDKIQDDEQNEVRVDTDTISSLFHKLHSQNFLSKKEDNGHQQAAEEHLRRSEELMKDCTERVDALEETLAHTPKPSEALNWGGMTLGDMLGKTTDEV
jgi:hypothetical protein